MLVPHGFVKPVAWAVIAGEMTIAVALCLPRSRLAALRASAALCSVFLGYSFWRGVQAIAAPCHCFGALFTMAPWHGLVLNAALLGVIAWLMVAEPPWPDGLHLAEGTS